MAQVPLDRSQMTKKETAARKIQDKADKDIDAQRRLRQMEVVCDHSQKRKSTINFQSVPNKLIKSSLEEEEGASSNDEEGAGDNSRMAGRKGDAIFKGKGKDRAPRGGTNLKEHYKGHQQYPYDNNDFQSEEEEEYEYLSEKENSLSGFQSQTGSRSSNSSNSGNLLRTKAPKSDNSLFGLGTFNLNDITKQALEMASKFPVVAKNQPEPQGLSFKEKMQLLQLEKEVLVLKAAQRASELK